MSKKIYYEGYCATFTRDKTGDKFFPNSFLYELPIPLFYEHKYKIGYIEDIKEDSKGLYVTFFTNHFIDHSNYKNNYYLSVGFILVKKENILYRNLKQVRIIEISIVKNPAQIGTKIKEIN